MGTSTATAADAPDIAAVRAAARRLDKIAVRTPLLESPALNERVGGRLLVKAEVLQRTGSFKFRGAYNKIAALGEAARSHGVVAFSSGNHAQAVAAAAALLGCKATIVMPHDAPAIKRRSTERHGATVIGYDRASEAREALAARIADETGAALVPPYDDPEVIAGQGTTGLEIAAQLADLGAHADALLAPVSGGGLIAGCALALKAHDPDVTIHAAEPEGFDDTARSLAGGTRVENVRRGGSLCDALMSPTPGTITFAINRRLLAGGIAVSDDEALAAMAAAFEHLKLVLEPGGSVALAAVLSGRFDARGKTVVAIASGGNVDPATFARALEAAA